MTTDPSTCWTAIRDAAGGDDGERGRFVERYTPVVRSYFEHRWRGVMRSQDLDDAVQEVFMECLKSGGVLQRASGTVSRSFRAFLHGVTRNVAGRFEQRRKIKREITFATDADLATEEASLERVFDRAFAQSVMDGAWLELERRARTFGAEARRRLDLLRLRFERGMPIRDIAVLWNADPSALHQAYSEARKEFKSALGHIVRFHVDGNSDDVERECRQLLGFLQ